MRAKKTAFFGLSLFLLHSQIFFLVYLSLCPSGLSPSLLPSSDEDEEEEDRDEEKDEEKESSTVQPKKRRYHEKQEGKEERKPRGLRQQSNGTVDNRQQQQEPRDAFLSLPLHQQNTPSSSSSTSSPSSSSSLVSSGRTSSTPTSSSSTSCFASLPSSTLSEPKKEVSSFDEKKIKKTEEEEDESQISSSPSSDVIIRPATANTHSCDLPPPPPPLPVVSSSLSQSFLPGHQKSSEGERKEKEKDLPLVSSHAVQPLEKKKRGRPRKEKKNKKILQRKAPVALSSISQYRTSPRSSPFRPCLSLQRNPAFLRARMRFLRSTPFSLQRLSSTPMLSRGRQYRPNFEIDTSSSSSSSQWLNRHDTKRVEERGQQEKEQESSTLASLSLHMKASDDADHRTHTDLSESSASLPLSDSSSIRCISHTDRKISRNTQSPRLLKSQAERRSLPSTSSSSSLSLSERIARKLSPYLRQYSLPPSCLPNLSQRKQEILRRSKRTSPKPTTSLSSSSVGLSERIARKLSPCLRQDKSHQPAPLPRLPNPSLWRTTSSLVFSPRFSPSSPKEKTLQKEERESTIDKDTDTSCSDKNPQFLLHGEGKNEGKSLSSPASVVSNEGGECDTSSKEDCSSSFSSSPSPAVKTTAVDTEKDSAVASSPATTKTGAEGREQKGGEQAREEKGEEQDRLRDSSPQLQRDTQLDWSSQSSLVSMNIDAISSVAQSSLSPSTTSDSQDIKRKAAWFVLPSSETQTTSASIGEPVIPREHTGAHAETSISLHVQQGRNDDNSLSTKRDSSSLAPSCSSSSSGRASPSPSIATSPAPLEKEESTKDYSEEKKPLFSSPDNIIEEETKRKNKKKDGPWTEASCKTLHKRKKFKRGDERERALSLRHPTSNSTRKRNFSSCYQSKKMEEKKKTLTTNVNKKKNRSNGKDSGGLPRMTKQEGRDFFSNVALSSSCSPRETSPATAVSPYPPLAGTSSSRLLAAVWQAADEETIRRASLKMQQRNLSAFHGILIRVRSSSSFFSSSFSSSLLSPLNAYIFIYMYICCIGIYV